MPQGSVLGPLFLIYINDITENIDSEIKLFADDTSLFITIDKNEKDITEQLNRDLEKISHWAKTWLVSFNPIKTKSLFVTLKKPRNHPDLLFDGHLLETVESHKHLGITFNSTLSWKHHIENIASVANKKVSLLTRLKHILDRKTLLIMYTSFVRPSLEYANVLWNNCTDGESDQLESIQRRAVRIITGGIIRSPTNLLYEEIGIETLKKRREKNIVLFFHKIIHNNAPSYLLEFKPIPNPHRVNLRSANNLTTPRCRLVKYQESFLPQAINSWNKLNNSLKETVNYKLFKALLEKDSPKVNPLFYLGDRKENIIMARLRMNCNDLKGHLAQLNIIENSVCECGYPFEDSLHYFFICPIYQVPRAALHNLISNIAPFTLQTILYGRENLNYNSNQLIYNGTLRYIKETNRFDEKNKI